MRKEELKCLEGRKNLRLQVAQTEREREMANAEALEVKFQIGSELFSARDRKERAGGGGGSLLQGAAFQKKGGYLRWMVVFFSAQGESSCNAGEKLLEYI